MRHGGCDKRGGLGSIELCEAHSLVDAVLGRENVHSTELFAGDDYVMRAPGAPAGACRNRVQCQSAPSPTRFPHLPTMNPNLLHVPHPAAPDFWVYARKEQKKHKSNVKPDTIKLGVSSLLSLRQDGAVGNLISDEKSREILSWALSTHLFLIFFIDQHHSPSLFSQAISHLPFHMAACLPQLLRFSPLLFKKGRRRDGQTAKPDEPVLRFRVN